MAKPPYFPFYVRDFVSDGKVEAMTTKEVGAYILLLCKAWSEDPPGSIPNDDVVLARWARLDSVGWAECRTGVLAAFTLGTDSRFHQKRMRSEFDKLKRVYRAKSEGGKRSAEMRREIQDSCKTLGKTLGNKNAAPGSGSVSASLDEKKNSFGSFRARGDPAETAEERATLPHDNPELFGPAKRIAAEYQALVKPAHDSGGAVPAIIGQLQSGRNETQLLHAVKAYAEDCASTDRPPRYRKSALRFFEAFGACEDYLEWKPKKSSQEMSPEELAEFRRKEREAFRQRNRTWPA